MMPLCNCDADEGVGDVHARNCPRFIDPWEPINEMARENEMLHAENALKLTQILDLEQLIFSMRNYEMKDKSPCWCVEYEDSTTHSLICTKARKVTESFWKR